MLAILGISRLFSGPKKKNLFFWLKFPNYQKLYKYSKTQKMIPLKLQKELKCTVGVKNFPKP